MLGKKITVFHVLIGLVVLTAILSYVSKPHPPYLELVNPRQELPTYKEAYPDFRSLSDRVSKSYSLALVLVQSQYSQKNAVALTAVRTWARQRFQQQPDFLIPIMVQPVDNTRQNFIGAGLYNLCAPINYWLQERVGEIIEGRIAAFHDSDAYISFRNAYFELFNVDNDSALLLARYQSDKAKEAIDMCLLAGFVLLAFLFAATYIARVPFAHRSAAYRRVLAGAWYIVSYCYMTVAWSQNDIPSLVSAVVAAAVGSYFLKPFVISSNTGSRKIEFISVPINWLALAYWTSYSLLLIQMVTWIHIGSPNQPDPISLIISSFTGDFLHDAVYAKRVIMQVLGISWLLSGIWAITRPSEDARTMRQMEETLASLKGPS